MINIFHPAIVIPAWLASYGIKRITGIAPEVVIGTAIYGAALTVGRLGRFTGRQLAKGYRKTRGFKAPALPQKPVFPASVLEFNSRYQLKDLQVILGHDHLKHEIRIDLDRRHTLLAGLSGAGKTTIINEVITQLVTRPGFREKYDLYLLDLKSSEDDSLKLWAPVITGYYGIDEDGSTQSATDILNHIVDTMHRVKTGRRIIVIIDEIAMLTTFASTRQLRRLGDATLRRIAAQLRDRGALFCATQYPRHDVIDRSVSGNLERKIALRVDDRRVARDIVLHMSGWPDNMPDPTSLKDGEFILREQGKTRVGRSMPVSLGQIDQAVSLIVERNVENDARLKLFSEVAGGLVGGGRLLGINKIRLPGWNVESLKTAYRNFALAGATTPYLDKNGVAKGYLLSGSYQEALSKLVGYIGDGKWRAAPEAIGVELSGESEE